MSRDTGVKPRIRIGQDVVILQNSTPGRVITQWRSEQQPWQYQVRSIARITGELSTDWLRADELAVVDSADEAAAAAEGAPA